MRLQLEIIKLQTTFHIVRRGRRGSTSAQGAWTYRGGMQVTHQTSEEGEAATLSQTRTKREKTGPRKGQNRLTELELQSYLDKSSTKVILIHFPAMNFI